MLFANIRPEEKVLFLMDDSGYFDPDVLETIAIGLKNTGAEIAVMMCREFQPRTSEPSDMVRGALLNCNKVIWASPHEAILHNLTGLEAMLDYGVGMITILANTKELMTSEWAKFPMNLFWMIARKVFRQVQAGKRIRVVGKNGTDLESGLHPMHMSGLPLLVEPCPFPPRMGNFGMFPPGPIGLTPEGGVNGTIVYDCLLGFKGILKTPVTLTVKDHWVVDVQGGPEADWFKETMKSKINGNWVAEISWGLNPKASIVRGLEQLHLREGELTRRAGTLHFGIGNSLTEGGKVYSNWHWDGVLITPFSVYVDDQPVVLEGRLLALDDPEVIHEASKYGDHKKLLKEEP